MSVESSFAIPFQSKYMLLKKSPDVLLKVSTSTVPYKKNGKHHTGKVSYDGFSAGWKQDKRTAVFLDVAWLTLTASNNATIQHYWHLWNKTNSYTPIKFASSHIIIHLNVSLASVSIIRVLYSNTNNIQKLDKVLTKTTRCYS